MQLTLQNFVLEWENMNPQDQMAEKRKVLAPLLSPESPVR